jgi:hypothetical protein
MPLHEISAVVQRRRAIESPPKMCRVYLAWDVNGHGTDTVFVTGL